MPHRSRALVVALTAGLLVTGLSVATASTADGAKRRCKTSTVPAMNTSTQTHTHQAQVRWAAGKNVSKYRLRWSPAPFDKWPGYRPSTAWVGKAARGTAVKLPTTPAARDRFLPPQYGNPVFVQLQVYNACQKRIKQSTYKPVWPKAFPPGNASTGDPLAFGSYNTEDFPTFAANRVKITNLAANIATKKLDVVALQEASVTTAADIATRLAREFGQGDWTVAKIGSDRTLAQQIIYRSGRFTEVASGKIGQAQDKSARTPLPTPWVRLAPADSSDNEANGLFVVSVHLEDFGGTVPVRKANAHAAAAALVEQIRKVNQPVLPTVVAGDLKGNFNAWCDESSKPACVGEGQPTFVRAGYLDAQAAVTKVGIQYGTVNKHANPQPANRSGFGGRADYILLKGFTGSARYEVVRRTFGNGSAAYQSDHNLITAHLFVPHVKAP